jgi:cation transporter-like permease
VALGFSKNLLEYGWAGAVAFLVLFLSSLLAGLQVAAEVTAFHLGGVAALRRGSRTETIVRYGLAIFAVLAALVGAIWFGVWAVLRTGSPGVAIFAILLALVALVVLLHGAHAFLTGVRERGDQDGRAS